MPCKRSWVSSSDHDLEAIPEKNGCRYKRIRRRVKGAPEPAEYQFKVASLERLERLAEQDRIDLFYGDESGVSLLPCVSSGWQFNDEQVCAPSTSGKGVNCFALLSRDNRLFFRLTEQVIDAALVCDYLDHSCYARV